MSKIPDGQTSVHLVCSEEEKLSYKKLAGGAAMDLSTWCRQQLNIVAGRAKLGVDSPTNTVSADAVWAAIDKIEERIRSLEQWRTYLRGDPS